MKKLIAKIFGIAVVEKTVNNARRFGSNPNYYKVVAYRESNDKFIETRLLMTEYEFMTITKRATENPEDFA
jgi:hypothetical protein